VGGGEWIGLHPSYQKLGDNVLTKLLLQKTLDPEVKIAEGVAAGYLLIPVDLIGRIPRKQDAVEAILYHVGQPERVEVVETG